MAIVFVLLSFGWMAASKLLRQNEGDEIGLDYNGFFRIPYTIMIIALIIALIAIWIRSGFLSFLSMTGITIGGFFVAAFIGFIISRILGREGFAIVIQLLCTIVSVVYLMVTVF